MYVKEEHMEKLKNSVIDWKDSLMESGFDIANLKPSVRAAVGESVDF